jgi:DNA polymerase (family 10)
MPMTNDQIAAALAQYADLLEIQGTDTFRLRAYRTAARAVLEYSDSIAQLVKNGSDLTEIDGIGKAIAQKCRELVETGSLRQLDELRAELPVSVLDLLRIPKLGHKKVAALFRELHITSLAQLKRACEAGQVRKLAGFGEKTEAAILAGMELAQQAGQRIYWAKADALVAELREHFRQCPAATQLEFAGSYRRGKETVGDLDILVVSADAESVMEHQARFGRIKAVEARGPTKMTLRVDEGFQVDLRVVPAESFGAALQYFTGSKEHNVELRGLAKQRGLKINEWGVFKLDGDKETYIAGRTEGDVYGTLGLPVFPPELREGRREFELARRGALPELITREDLRGDLHMHTIASDGSATIGEMVTAARSRGLAYIAITDHSQRVAMARGLDATRLAAQWSEIDRLNEELTDFFVFKGIECDILEDGRMDLDDEILSQADWVLASVHYGQDQPAAQITRRILNAVENPHVDIIAHPTGRLLNRRKPYDVNLDEVFAAVVSHRKRLELNANPARLDLNDVHCAKAAELGIPIAINSDAHSPEGIDVLRFGIVQARRAGLTRANVLNTLGLAELRQQLAAG